MVYNSIEQEVEDIINSINDEALRAFPDDSPFVCLFSGGKDSGLAISMASDYSKPMALIYYMDFNDKTYVHNRRLANINQQARAMEIPLETYEGGRKTVRDLHKFAKTLKKYADMGAKYLVSGSIYDILAYKINSKLAGILNMEFKSPLWKLPNEEIMQQIEKRNIKSVITCITELLPHEMLGQIFDRNIYNEIRKMGIDPLCDSCEYDTTLVDSDCFKKKVYYKSLESNDSFNLEIEISC